MDIPFPINNSFPILPEGEWEGINAPITEDEIRRTLFVIRDLKAASLDGLHALFFQSS